jgi:RNA polymerase sigma-70 factor (ECF subfamily)
VQPRPDAAAVAHERQLAHTDGTTIRPTEVNGQPGALFLARDGRLMRVMTLDVADGVVRAVRSVINPAKLRHLGPLADVRALMRERR